MLLSEYLAQFDRSADDMRPICLMLTYHDFRGYDCTFEHLRVTLQDVCRSHRVDVTTRSGEVVTLKNRSDHISLDDHRIIHRPDSGTIYYDLGI